MIKFTLPKSDGQKILGFAITETNVERLKQGDPIYFDLNELGVAGYDVLIMYGKDQEDIGKQLKEAALAPEGTKFEVLP
jgi:hypothetical protein